MQHKTIKMNRCLRTDLNRKPSFSIWENSILVNTFLKTENIQHL